MQKHPDLPKAFEELGVEVPILKALQKIGYEQPSEIQSELIPVILEGNDVIGQARTGTGKTASFGIPHTATDGEGKESASPLPRPDKRVGRTGYRRDAPTERIHRFALRTGFTAGRE